MLLFFLIRSLYVEYWKSRKEDVLTKIKALTISIKNRLGLRIKSIRFRLKTIAIRVKGDEISNANIMPAGASLRLIPGRPSVSIARGEKFFDYAGLFWTVLAVVYIELNSSYMSSHPQADGVSLLLLFDLAGITYLCFASSWFRNKIARIINLRLSNPD